MTTSDLNRVSEPDGNALHRNSTGGDGPAAEERPSHQPYHHPAAGWGAAKSVSKILVREHALVDGARAIHKMNHENGGFDCPGCAWPDDMKGLRLDICENGIKHVTWEMTHKRVGSNQPLMKNIQVRVAPSPAE